MKVDKVGFIGFGLIGGSIARGLKKEYKDITLAAYNYYETKEHPKLQMAKNDGVLDEIYTDLKDMGNCDLIFLCAPVRSNIAYLTRLKPFLSPHCLLTDVGSVKKNIHQAVRELGLDRQFIGGHPMTGSEKMGYEHGAASLLHNAYYILTPTPETCPEYVPFMEEMICRLGAKSFILDPAHHDDIVAAISHIPHILASSLVHMVSEHPYAEEMGVLAAGSFRDMTRVAASSPVMWQDILLTNADSILPFIQLYKEHLSAFEKALQNNDADALLHLFSRGKQFRDDLYQRKERESSGNSNP